MEPLLKPRGVGLQLRRRCREFANTNGNQGSWRRGGAGRHWRACAQDAALGAEQRQAPSSRGAGAHTRFGGSLPQGCVPSTLG